MHLFRIVSDLQGCDLQHLDRQPISTTQAVKTFSLYIALGKMKAISHIMPSMAES